MRIIAHRGIWSAIEEQNSLHSIEAAMAGGFGVEIDVRDLCGTLVVSHDPPIAGAPLFRDVVNLARKYPGVDVAINLKADGLSNAIENTIPSEEMNRYFLFDCSVPQLVHYLDTGLTVYARRSEFESDSDLTLKADGVWLDGFYSEWYPIDLVTDYILHGKKLCIVSPELHSRDPFELWGRLRQLRPQVKRSVAICTDMPEEANLFFHQDGESL